MKLNVTTKIVGEQLLLVPYRKHHVKKYNEWMSIKEIQELTSSEPLSLDEEYTMQKTWQEDEDKLTFIILKRDVYDSTVGDQKSREIAAMIGDVNVFLYSDENGPINSPKDQAELEVMIVDKENRGHGFGSESIKLLMTYTYQSLKKLKRFFVKIDEVNEASIRMFTKLDFIQYEYVRAFKQISLKIDIDDEFEKIYNVKLNIDQNYINK